MRQGCGVPRQGVLQHPVSCAVGEEKRHSEGTRRGPTLSAQQRERVFYHTTSCLGVLYLAFLTNDCWTNPRAFRRVCELLGAVSVGQGDVHSSEN